MAGLHAETSLPSRAATFPSDRKNLPYFADLHMPSHFSPPDLTAARLQMVEMQIEARGICNAALLEVMRQIPRERFVNADPPIEAYTDRALPIEACQTISQPYIVALMTESLALLPEHTILEIGTGSGYQTAILARLARFVHTVERIESLTQTAAQRIAELNLQNVAFHVADGSLGWPAAAPYDRIIVTAGAPRVPAALIDQLADGGRLIAPVGGEEHQTLVVIEKTGQNITESAIAGCRFVKLIGAEGWSPV